MAHEVVWSPRAIQDVDSIASYIAADSTAYASAVVQKIIDTTRNLSRFPLGGRMVPELDDKAVREHIVYSYRVIYRVEEKQITIVAVIHGKRILAPQFPKGLP
ncbi:MAG TPA: type II toxin-antitoxin system RelE/ParE family toxin [Terriglobales bacterium]|nr:type II toxin-antitoxin system RelE/ParE family toxin [Terriglobales bacterium]